MDARDLLGKRGEYIACSRLLDFCGNPKAYFNPYPLGEKCPLFDLLVELEGSGNGAAYFLAQVKTTARRAGKRATRLAVEVGQADVERMARSPFPAYLIGVDEPREQAYVVSMHGGVTGPVYSMPRKYPLTAPNLKALWEEVADYWAAVRAAAAARTSRFTW